MGRKRGCAAEMRNGMNQKERMLAGLPYKAWLDGLSEERMENKKRIYRYNSLSPEQGEEQAALIKEIIGKCGENIWIETPFHCDYGWNIEVGENFFCQLQSDNSGCGKSGNREKCADCPECIYLYGRSSGASGFQKHRL